MIALWLACAAPSPPVDEHSGDTAAAVPAPTLWVPEIATGEISRWAAGSGALLQTLSMSELYPERCQSTACTAHGVDVDGDGLLVTFSMKSSVSQLPGGVLRVLPESGVRDWVITELDGLDCGLSDGCELDFPHATGRDPSDGALIVADTFQNRVAWLAPGVGEGAGTLLAELDETHADWGDASGPNGVQVFTADGRDWLLVSWKVAVTDPAGASGSVGLWDISDRAAPVLAWRFPERGFLHQPHGALLHADDDGWLLLYAHSLGLQGRDDGRTGSIGVARASLDAPPTYLADLALADEDLAYPREAELREGELYIAESGCVGLSGDCGSVGRVLTAALPSLYEPGLGGSWTADGSDQALVLLEGVDPLVLGLSVPFEVDVVD